MATTSDPNQKTPLEIREIQELAIAISAKNLNPTMLSQEFLKQTGIVPNEWELGKQPVLGPNLSQVTFQNGVSIVAQPRNITFMESIGTKNPSELNIPNIARQYVEKLSNAEYQGLSISPKSLIPFPGGEDGARNYITRTLLSPGSWQDYGKAPVQAGLNLLYQLDRCQFSLSINEAKIQMPDQSSIPALLFAGNFNYNVGSNSQQEILAQLKKGIDDWSSDLKDFQEIVNQRFLTQQQQTVFPGA
ncbi:hypothetical protein VB715_04470 [Crocosphaera sp. UHCC 0190]|uniref:hypothetical protein n=1 Tax=Crocosphaera sp. UHCC 0190 TaxID=3110246 RepID=UPI002B2216B2|nr:hypothetical protein [Crocosphaera sp. UHCC 0190]MEA5509012.1 hypothetical protein [Crocosphaera sp. UHCC 0190]